MKLKLLDVVQLKNGKEVTVLHIYNDRDIQVEGEIDGDVYDVPVIDVEKILYEYLKEDN